MRIQVVYATSLIQKVVELDVPEGTTVYRAAELSGLAVEFSEIKLESIPMGIFGILIKTATTRIVHRGDRVELYRSLIVDPKESRRNRAEFQKSGRF